MFIVQWKHHTSMKPEMVSAMIWCYIPMYNGNFDLWKLTFIWGEGDFDLHQTVGVDDPRLTNFYGEIENSCIQVYLSFVQHESQDVANCSLLDFGIRFKDPGLV